MTGFDGFPAADGRSNQEGIGVKMKAWDGPGMAPPFLVYILGVCDRHQMSAEVFGDGTDNPTFGESALAASPGCLVSL